MNQPLSYLKQLKFEEKLRNSFIGKYLSNPRLIILVITAIILIGVTSFNGLARTLNPEIKIPIIIVSTVLPGAGPADIESLITVPIEDSVTGLENVKTVTSNSQDSVSVVSLEFNSGIDPEKARTDVQGAIDTVTLPNDAQTPKVQKIDFANQPVWSFALTGRGDTQSLTRFAKVLRDNIKNLPNIQEVTLSGIDEQEIEILLKPEAITTYGLSPLQLSQLIKTANASFPAGTITTDNGSFALSIDPTVTSLSDIRNLRVTVQGTPILLSDIATVVEKAKPGQKDSYLATYNKAPEKVIRFDIFKTSSAGINKAAQDAIKTADTTIAQYEHRFEIKSIVNSAEEISKQFDDLLRDFSITIGLVFITLFLFLGLRQAMVATLAAPLTFLISFIAMQYTGISLSFIALFSLLLSLGLLVDDTIVVLSAITAYHRTGRFTPLESGLLVWRDFILAIFTTTLTTVWAFLPLLLASGIIGEFIKTIPIVVSSTLLASFLVAMLVVLPLMILLLNLQMPRRVVIFLRVVLVIILLAIFYSIIPKGIFLIPEIIAFLLFMFVTAQVRLLLIRRTKTYVVAQGKKHPVIQEIPRFIDHGVISFEKVTTRYQAILTRILRSNNARRQVITMVLIFSLASYLLLPLGFIKNEFFPASDAGILYVSLELPPGTNLTSNRKESLAMIEQLRTTEGLEYVIANIGQTLSESGGTTGGQNNTTLFTLVLHPKNERTITSMDLAIRLREQFTTYTTGKVSVIEQSGGPPAGSDIQIKLFGDDLTTLNASADKVMAYLAKQPVTNIDKSIKPGTSKLVFVPDQQTLATNGVSVDQLGIWLRLHASGVTADSVKFANEGNEEKDITLRTTDGYPTAESISSLSMPTQTGNIQLTTLGKVKLAVNPTLITREDGKRTISVTAGVGTGVSTSDIGKNLEKFADSDLQLPTGYSWKTGGVNEENQNSVNSILQAMLLSFFLIIVTMVLQFSSFRKALIVMLVIPLSISGVFIVFAFTHTPLSFPALIGVLALFGIVVKNSILIVDKINQNIEHGMDFRHAIIDGAGSRLEAIALTSFATIVGLIPITLSDPLWRGLGGAIISGLLFSGTIMLFFIPVVYYYWMLPREEK
ncbi:N/A [soil metagenome]